MNWKVSELKLGLESILRGALGIREMWEGKIYVGDCLVELSLIKGEKQKTKLTFLFADDKSQFMVVPVCDKN